MFKNDLQVGISGEKEFAQFLADEKGFTSFTYNDTESYDILAVKETPDGIFEKTFEIKKDMYERDTGNLAIEVACVRRAKVTGLWSTKAQWFVYMKREEWYIFAPEKLKEYLATHEVKITRGGDKNNALIFLLPEIEAREIATNVIFQ